MSIQPIRIGAVLLLLLLCQAGASVLHVDLNSTNPVSPYADWLTAATNIQDAIDHSTDGDVILVTDGIYHTGGRVADGSLTNRVVVDKAVTVRSVNGPAGTIIDGGGAVRCAYLTNGAALTGFTLTNGFVSGDGGGVWCESSSAVVSNCVLTGNMATHSGGAAYGGTLANCILANNTVSYPPQYWTTSGGGAFGSALNHCLLVTNSASGGGGAEQCVLNNSVLIGNQALWGGGADGSQLTNCAVTGNAAQSGAGSYNSALDRCTVASNRGQYGGGAEFCALTGCILATNITYDDEVYGLGGGADSSTMTNCLIYGNVSSTSAGASASTLINCTVVSNITTQVGGAVDACALYNSIIYYNTTPDGTNCSNSTLTNCCTLPVPDLGTGNITNEPLFIVSAPTGFHLQSNSPCINSGGNSYVTITNDLDGKPRIVGGTVDIGAYEYQTAASILSYAWLQLYGLPTDGSADHLDSDGDGMNNWQEWKAGTNPTNRASVLVMLAPASTNSAAGVAVSWQSVNTRTYHLERATNLTVQPAFSTLQSNIVGQAGATSYTDTTATNSGPFFYRVGAQ